MAINVWMGHFSMSLTFFVILCKTSFSEFCAKSSIFSNERRICFFLSCALVSDCGRGTRRNKPSPSASPPPHFKLYVGAEVQAPILLRGRAGLTPLYTPTLLVLCFLSCFLLLAVFFSEVLPLSQLIWYFSTGDYHRLIGVPIHSREPALSRPR